MKTITRRQFRRYLERVRGAKPITIVARTVPDFVGGKKCPVANVHKIAVVNAMINTIYGNAVNRQREREASPDDVVEHFIPKPRRWGMRLHDELTGKIRPLITHRPKNSDETLYYLECQVKKSLEHRYFDETGKEVPAAEVEPHLRKKQEGARQEVERPVILRDYALSNIQEARIGNEVFVLV